jgi:hypothetical protein
VIPANYGRTKADKENARAARKAMKEAKRAAKKAMKAEAHLGHEVTEDPTASAAYSPLRIVQTSRARSQTSALG